MKWKIANFAFLFSTVYMELTLGVKIAEQIDVITGICFTSITTSISLLGYLWLDKFRIRRQAAAESLRRWKDVVQKTQANGNKISFHHMPPEKSGITNYYIVPRGDDIRGA